MSPILRNLLVCGAALVLASAGAAETSTAPAAAETAAEPGNEETGSAIPRGSAATADPKPAEAEEVAEERDPLLVAEDGLEAEVQNLIDRIQKIDLRLKEATGEEHTVLFNQATELRLEGLARYHDILDNVRAQEKAGLDTSLQRSRLEPRMQQISGRLGEMIVIEAERIQELQSTAFELEGEAQHDAYEDLNDELERHDKLYKALDDHILEIEAFGLSADATRTWMVEHLGQRADSLAAWVKHLNEEIAGTQDDLEISPSDTALKLHLAFEEKRLDASAASLDVTVRLMHKYGLDTSDYRGLLIQTTGEITRDLLDARVAMRLLRDFRDSCEDWISEHGVNALSRIVIFFLIMGVVRLVAIVSKRLVLRAVTPSINVSQLLRHTIESWASNIVMILGTLVALASVGVELAPLLAGLGVLGFIVGFALQDTLGNFASGAMILLYRPYDVGDMIECAGGVFGKVDRMSLVSTTILTIDNQTLVVPNSKIWGDVIKNVTAQEIRRVDMKFSIAHSDDIEVAQQLFSTLLSENEMVLADPEPMIHLHELTDFSVVFIVRPWVKTADYWDVFWWVTREVKVRFAQVGLHIPVPQRGVQLLRESQDGGEDGSARS